MTELGVEHHPPAALLSHVLVTVLCVHVVLTEGTDQEVKLGTIDAQQFGEQLGLCLLRQGLESVAVDEVAFFLGVRVQVNVKRQTAFAGVVETQLSHCKAGRLFL